MGVDEDMGIEEYIGVEGDMGVEQVIRGRDIGLCV